MPSATIPREELERFKKDLEEFEYWLSTVENKRNHFSGKISSVLPSLYRTLDNGYISTRLNGFLIRFDRGYIGYDLFDDAIYLRVGNIFLERHSPAAGDDIEFEAKLINDRGRLIFLKPSAVEITQNGNMPMFDYSKALVAKSTGAIVKDDIRLCRDCPYGSLLDIEEISPKENRYRRFYCLRGVEQAYNCPIRLDRILAKLNESAGA